MIFNVWDIVRTQYVGYFKGIRIRVNLSVVFGKE